MSDRGTPDPGEPERPAVEQACLEYADGQLADIDSFVQSIVHGMVVRMPSLYDVSYALRAEMRRWLRQLAVATMRCLRDGTDFDVLVPGIEAVARRRKNLGIEQSQTMMSSRYGQQALLDHAQEFFRGHPHEAEMLAQIMPRLMEFQHVMTLSVASGYASEPDADQISDRQARIQLLLELLSGRRPGQGRSQVQELAARLGLNPSVRLVTVSAELKEDPVDQVRSIARMNHWAVVGLIDRRAVAMTVRAPNAFPAPRGVSALHADAPPEQIAAAVDRAAMAADVAGRLRVPELNAVDAAPFAAVLALPEAEQLAYVHSCFGELPHTARGRALLGAVSAALTNDRLGEAAQALHVHRHTLDYRLRRFSEQTSLDLSKPAARLRCMVGLFIIDLLPSAATA